MREQPELLTAEEVANALRVSRMTVSRLRRAGTLPAVAFGGVFRYKRSDLDAFIAANRSPEGAS